MKKVLLVTSNPIFIRVFKIASIFTSSIALIFILTSFGVFGKLPSVKEIKNPNLSLASEIISSDGVVLGKLGFENRTTVTYNEIPKNLIDALIATEDERFYSHGGIDLRSTARAVCKPGSGGASTITQQLAKNLFTREPSKSFVKRVFQKLKEWVIAVKIERNYTKEEILAMYLNTQDFVFNAVGIESASNIYFGKQLKDLKVEEAAVLVAMLKNPVLYNPNIDKFKNNSLRRRNIVFKQMHRNDFITKKEKDSLQNLPLELNFSPETHYTGSATYFRSHLQKEMLEWSKDVQERYGKKYDIYRDGLKIYVTIDSRMQKYAEESVNEHMSNLQHHFNKEQARNRTAPFYNLSKSEINSIYNRAKRNSQRYKRLKKQNKSEKYIDSIFNVKREMTVFTYNGEKDTVFSPMDSIKYYKTFLRSGLLSVEPQTGYVKAWVGGVNFKYFN